jgi:NAD(P)-dependent dehydrogenase (short-subunit alcohol dehydrogenase family)
VDVEVGQHLPILGYEPALPTLRNIYSNDYQFFYGLPGVATGVFVTTHVNQQLDVEGAVTLGTPTFFASLSVAPVYMGVVNYRLEDDKKTMVTLGVVTGPFNPQSNVVTTTQTVTVSWNWNEHLTQAVQFSGCYSNAVAPSLTSTDATTELEKSEAAMAAFRDRLPSGRPATPDEIAGVIAFLASEDALFVNGVILPVDGGLHASNGQPNFLSLLGQG